MALLIGLNVLVDYHVGAAVNIASCALYLKQTCRGEPSSMVELRLKLMFGSIWLPRTEALEMIYKSIRFQVFSLLMVLLLTCDSGRIESKVMQ